MLYKDSRVDSTTDISLTIFTRQRLPSDIYTLFSFFYLSDISLGFIFIFLLFIIQIQVHNIIISIKIDMGL